MADRKEKILLTALTLFAQEGYKGVSTNKIAKAAGVSEGLIFRHYKSKQGLLEAILEEGFERMNTLFEPLLQEQNPQEVIEKYIRLPFAVDKGEYEFWKLLFKLKWEIEYATASKMKPIHEKLTEAFRLLGYKAPEKEAEVLLHIIDSISGAILKDGLETQQFLKDFLLNKYKLNP